MENEIKNINELNTPCFLFDELEFEKNICGFFSALKKYFNDSIIGYSFKTNSLPRVLYLAKKCGCYAEVVSDDEYCLAKKIGYTGEHIIFNGPAKGKTIFMQAIQEGSLVNIDSQREIDWLFEVETEKKIDVGIRVNFDLEQILQGQTSTGIYGGRFGFCYENGELASAIYRIKSIKNVRITRLHMHVSNASKSIQVYETLAEMACRIIEETGMSITCIDFGGGFFGGGDDGESYIKYASAIYNVLRKHNMERKTIIIEPGASVIATAFSYLTSVIDIKKTTYSEFVVTDGSRLHIDPFMTKEKYNYKIIPRHKTCSNKAVVCGYTCMEKDRFMSIRDVGMNIGDRIEYGIVGSYTLCFNTLFISYLPRVYSKMKDGKYKIVRDKWTVEEYVQGCRWDI